ncbi:unnamed protein product [Closterium sp. NIES-65]|nr:unnamed protein product [Closterium sp. NIES-65]
MASDVPRVGRWKLQVRVAGCGEEGGREGERGRGGSQERGEEGLGERGRGRRGGGKEGREEERGEGGRQERGKGRRFSVLVQSECDTLDFAPDYLERVNSTGSHVMAQWVLTVLPSTKSFTEPVTEPAAAAESQPSSKLFHEATDGPDSPCDHSIHGRWLFTPQKQAYTWQLYHARTPPPHLPMGLHPSIPRHFRD